MHKYVRLALSIIACQLAGIVGAVFTTPNIAGWYSTLNKPWFTPPNWVFGPMWLTLYMLMGVALWLVWGKGKNKKNLTALWSFKAQLLLNILWSIAFFGLRSPLFGLLVIIPLWLMIGSTIYSFRKVNRNAAYLLVPYLLWVTLATALNLAIYILN